VDRRGGMPTGAKLKKQNFDVLVTQFFAAWLSQVVEVRSLYGVEFAVEFVNESKKKFDMTEKEYEYALSVARKA
jgi:hypothetical protein